MTPQRPDRIVEARRTDSTHVYLRFADGKSGTWSLKQLELDPTNLDTASIKAGKLGMSLEAKTRRGEKVSLDASWLRAAVDSAFDSKLQEELLAIRGPLNNLIVTAPKT